MKSDPLGWLEPRALAMVLADRFGQDGLVLLDGDGSPLGRHGVLGVNPLATVCCRGLPGSAGAADPFAALAALQQRGGPWLGWLGYEAGAWVEPADHWQDADMATLWAACHDPLIHFDRGEQRLWLEGRDPARLTAMTRLLQDPATHAAVVELETRPDTGGAIPRSDWHWHTSPERYAEQVRTLREWIAAGDLFQANLTACCESVRERRADPLALYRRLVRRGPAPFAGLAVAGAEAVISASPERFLRLHPDGRVETRPIKGTRPRHHDPEADAASAADLICDPKDRAENVMIVDLLRNDLGRVCVPGSVHVPQLLGLESYAHVHHLTSVVMGRLAEGHGLVDLLRACWPGGSITGAPKVRACRRLNQLEPVPRGPYCGSLFHLGADGGFDSSILIRTVLQRGRRLRLHAGGGIVADSDPEGEAREMGWKIEPLLEALA
ncbi:anthranilate synthase component I family protein [Synechococcus sp. CCY 9618]|uniref:anthranilate synthase component I family protein n=1 Tax=Synechococcus sp. CCY 9618 TaxID=2815602 RepID=UPI0020B1A9AD|nr:anthranilate synthase component I family protein [Synechococcus sp. CCY 9618]